MFLVFDGRSAETPGVTLEEVQKVLLQNGVIDAAKVGSCSATTMYYNGNIVNNIVGSKKEEWKVPATFMAVQ